MNHAQGGTEMIGELIHSCAHGAVARAALISIGPGFAERVRRVARESGASDEGVFVACKVREFAREAGDGELGHLAGIMSGKDQPMLEGLRFILDHAIAQEHDARRCG